jgi:tetratricopeptide (TPR) repeat protein
MGLLLAGCSGSDTNRQAGEANAESTPPAPSADHERTAGMSLLKEKQYGEAVEHLTRALELSRTKDEFVEATSREAEVYDARGRAYLKMGFPDTAAADFNAAVELSPRFVDAVQHRARAYLELGDTYKAVRDATDAIRLKPHNAEAYHIRGLAYNDRLQYDRAVVDLEQATKENPDLRDEVRALIGQAYYRWSQQLAEDGAASEAAEKLAKARDLNPEYVQEQAVAEADQQPPATSVQRTAAKPVIDEAEKLFQQGRAHQLSGRYDQALIEFTHAIALRSDFDQAYLRRGETLLDMGFPDTALEDLRHAAKHDGGSAEAFRLQARAFLALNNPNRAELSATDALHEDPSDAAAYALRGEAYLQIENWSRAIADFDEAIRRDPALKDRLQPLLDEARQGPERRRQQEARQQAARDAIARP